jgi:hypothetical protein
MFKRIVLITVVVLFLVIVGITMLVNNQSLPASELVRRCSASQPKWTSYPEDIKGQIGAGPAAQWAGKPVAAAQSGSQVRVTFRLQAPWSGFEAAMPVLLRDPLGHVYRNASTEKKDADRIYLFTIDADAAVSVLPWVEVQYPHGEKRISFNAQGRWPG